MPAAGGAAAAKPQQAKPNVLIIIADDLNYYNIGCYGAVNNKTPNIDALAGEGMLFTQAYNSVSMSTPTRHCLYTGMYPMHNGGHANHSRVRPDIKTMPVYMTEAGYRAGLAGKWHVQPEKIFSFEKIPGFTDNCTTLDPSHDIAGVREFILRDSSQPFCMVLASVNPHAPWTGGDPSVYDPAKLVLPPNWGDTEEMRKQYANYMAEVTLLDQEVGEAVEILKKNGLWENTLVIFVSEQGGQPCGAKWTNWNAGVHAAMIATWPGKIKKGSRTDAIVQYEDILPTIVTLAGGEPVDMDGRDITPVLTGKAKTHRKYAFHSHTNVPEGPPYPIRAVSDGRYRLIWNLTPEKQYVEKHVEKNAWFISWKESSDEHAKKMVERWYHRPEFELYDISKDPYEMNNLAGEASLAAKKAELLSALKGWMAEQKDPGAAADKERPAAKAQNESKG